MTTMENGPQRFRPEREYAFLTDKIGALLLEGIVSGKTAIVMGDKVTAQVQAGRFLAPDENGDVVSYGMAVGLLQRKATQDCFFILMYDRDDRLVDRAVLPVGKDPSEVSQKDAKRLADFRTFFVGTDFTFEETTRFEESPRAAIIPSDGPDATI